MHMLYFEDFQVGDAVDLGPLTVTEEEIIAFARQFDPQYFHVDPERAKHSIFGGLVASGWHCGALFTRMFVDGLLSRMVSMGSPGLEQVRWIQPVRPDDTLRGRFTVLEARISKSRPAMGILRVGCEMFNQRDECGAVNRSVGKFCVVCGKPLSMYPGKSGPAATGLLTSTTLLKQRYRVIRKIGEGGFSAVYLAEDSVFNAAPRVLKEMSMQLASSQHDPQELQRSIEAFKQEALLLAGLTHPNLPRIYDHFEEQQRWYIVMDYIEGQTVETLLEATPARKLGLSSVLHIANQLCMVLNYLHTRQPPIIFRDLKPANIMITEEEHIYLIDFGIARLFKPGQTKDTAALGSPGYAAPEQYGRAQSTPQADIYSLGATLHYLLSGRDPSDDPFQFPPLALDQYAAGPDLAALIQRTVSLQRDQRPASAQEVKQELQKLYSPSQTIALPQLNNSQSSQVRAYIQEAYAQGQLGHYEEQLAAAEAALRLDPKCAQAYGHQAHAFGRMGHYQEELEAAEAAILLDSGNSKSYAQKAHALGQLGRYREQLTAAEAAIRLDPQYVRAYDQKAYALDYLGRYQEVLVVADFMIRLDPRFIWAYTKKAHALGQLGRYREQLAAVEAAILLDPHYVLAYTQKAYALEKLAMYQEELAAAESALLLDPLYVRAYTHKAFALGQLGRYQEELATAETAIRLDPQCLLAYSQKAYALGRLKRYQEELATAEAALRLDPLYTPIYEQKAHALGQLGRYREQLATAEAALRLEPGNVYAHRCIQYARAKLQRH